MRRTILPALAVLALIITGLFVVIHHAAGPSTRTPDTVAVIGDSLTDMSGRGATQVPASLDAVGRGDDGVYFWGVGGKRLVLPDSRQRTTLQNIADARARLGQVGTWVIALGTNDTVATETTARFKTDVDEVLDALGSDRFVWINLAFWSGDNTKAARFNPVLEGEIAKRPHGRYADWNSYIHEPVRNADDLWLHTTTKASDFTHMSTKGYRVRADYYAARVAAMPLVG